jgi:SAM-dependent methyltransferase
MPKYSHDIVTRIITEVNLPSIKAVCEFGAGTGYLSQIFELKTGIKPHCVEIDSILIGVLSERGFTVTKTLRDAGQKFDLIFSANVLEHIPDHLLAVKQMLESLNTGGHIAVFVPAFPILFSDMDRKVGHVRRYRKSDLKELCTRAGFDVKCVYYTDPIGFFGNLLVRVMGWRRGFINLGGQKSTLFYENHILPMSKFLEKFGTRVFLGKNLILIGKKV